MAHFWFWTLLFITSCHVRAPPKLLGGSILLRLWAAERNTFKEGKAGRQVQFGAFLRAALAILWNSVLPKCYVFKDKGSFAMSATICIWARFAPLLSPESRQWKNFILSTVVVESWFFAKLLATISEGQKSVKKLPKFSRRIFTCLLQTFSLNFALGDYGHNPWVVLLRVLAEDHLHSTWVSLEAQKTPKTIISGPPNQSVLTPMPSFHAFCCTLL